MLDKAKAIELIKRQIQRGKALALGQSSETGSWQLDSIAVLERVCGANSRQVETFRDIRWTPHRVFLNRNNDHLYQAAYETALARSIMLLESSLAEVVDFWDMDHSGLEADPFRRIERISNRFQAVARQLCRRHDSRKTLEVSDEYDVQDLIHALLLVDFDDVRPEEWNPSYAGASSRMDFLLKREQIVVEVKMTRKGLTDKEVGEQLLIDCQRYKAHPECKMLVCFVYDPDGLIRNPRGLENDLATAGADMPVRVFIRPS